MDKFSPYFYIKHFKNECPWTYILSFNNFKFLEKLKINRKFYITSKNIKEILKSYNGKKSKQNEPRLLCYQNSSNDRPTIFKKLNLFILPTKNGEYLIHTTNIYAFLEYSINSDIIKLPKNNDSILLNIGNSESNHISIAYYSNIFKNIINEEILYANVLSGRHRTPSFDIFLNDKNINVKGVQYEIDGSYESKNKIIIVEAKNGKKMIKSFNVRQLYYPYRVIIENLNKFKSDKQVVLLFFHYLKGIYFIWEYSFNNINEFNSIYLVKLHKYALS